MTAPVSDCSPHLDVRPFPGLLPAFSSPCPSALLWALPSQWPKAVDIPEGPRGVTCLLWDPACLGGTSGHVCTQFLGIVFGKQGPGRWPVLYPPPGASRLERKWPARVFSLLLLDKCLPGAVASGDSRRDSGALGRVPSLWHPIFLDNQWASLEVPCIALGVCRKTPLSPA